MDESTSGADLLLGAINAHDPNRMATLSTAEIVNRFTEMVAERLDESKLDGPVRLDNTHTVVIIPLKDRGPIHAHIHGVDDQAVENVLAQIRVVPSLKGLVRES